LSKTKGKQKQTVLEEVPTDVAFWLFSNKNIGNII
jgi:hypothetical protein